MVFVFLCLTEGFKQGMKGFSRHREGVQDGTISPKTGPSLSGSVCTPSARNRAGPDTAA